MDFFRQKCYADNGKRDLEFEVGYLLYFKISPIKWVRRFVMKGKLSPFYVGPNKILKRVGSFSYELRLPKKLAMIHPVFHFSIPLPFFLYKD